MNKLILIPAFILMVLLQLYFPAKMITRKEAILSGGKEYKFRTAPIDPHDPFRGKYIILSFEANSTHVTNAEGWNSGDAVFVILGEDEKGFVKINTVSKDKPVDEENFVKASIGYVVADTLSYVTVDYPFDRFYMEESKAQGAETAYAEAARDTNQVAYALISIKNGDAVIKDVMINDVPISEVVKAMQKEERE